MSFKDRGFLFVFLGFVLAGVFLFIGLYSHDSSVPEITFYGGVRGIGASALVIRNAGESVLIDFGSSTEGGKREVPFNVRDISFVIITHAHTDHCGALSELFQEGFEGPVYCTQATSELVPVMLRMVRSLNRRGIRKESLNKAIASIVPVRFGQKVRKERIGFVFRRAEHLLGAAFVELELYTGDDTVRVIVSGDLGGGNSVLLRPMDKPSRADFVVVESTYGDIARPDSMLSPIERKKEFARTVAAALMRGGDVLIPAFALGRTQEVMATIDYYIRTGVIPRCDVYVDSPTARRINRIYRRFPEELSELARKMYPVDVLRFREMREVKSKVSLKVHNSKHNPSIFISTSGNLDYAISPRHLLRMFDDPKNLVMLVGYQEPGSVGYRLLRGDSTVAVRDTKSGKKFWISPSCSIESTHSFSGHADQRVLLRWLSATGRPNKVFIVHGDIEKSEALGRAIEERLGLEYIIPFKGKTYKLAS